MAGGVHHKQIFLRSQAVKEKVVDDPSMLVQQEGILSLPIAEFGGVVGEKGRQGGESPFPEGADLPHMRDIKEAGRLTGGFVFGKKPAVFHGQIPAGKGNHACAQGLVAKGEGAGGDGGHEKLKVRCKIP